jgi:hypothetical protein
MAAIDYPHIPVQVLFPRSDARLVRADIQTRGERVASIMGPGDEVPAALEQMGYRVSLLDDDDLTDADLEAYDAIVTGVRAYNTRERLAVAHQRLLDYVAGGGTLVMQYNNSRGLVTDALGPWPLGLSRGRVTVEEAPMTPVDPDHPLLTFPNRITAADFEGWVQERGLYFPGSWDEHYQPVLRCSDPGEEPLEGGLLYAHHGDGVFIYTGFAFFRQLPAGVPGAWRLFANLVSAGGGR